MPQERVIAQVKPRLQHCLEQRDRPGVVALTTWLVHRHGHALLQQLLSQPEWSSHRLWWGEQIGRLRPDLQPQSRLQPHCKTIPTGKERQDDRTEEKLPVVARSAADQAEPAPGLRQHPGPEAGLPLDGHPESRTEPVDQIRDDVKPTPAQVTKRRLKMDQSAKPVPPQGKNGDIPTVTPANGKQRSPNDSPDRQHRSLHLRSWLPRSRLPHQCPRQDAA